jgi:hypothetical protein
MLIYVSKAFKTSTSTVVYNKDLEVETNNNCKEVLSTKQGSNN